eukprot:m.317536 g.317536  ORF g.317536 m.317536 type:complete len:903 (+) comp16509_c1_seq6:256-2964(+)
MHNINSRTFLLFCCCFVIYRATGDSKTTTTTKQKERTTYTIPLSQCTVQDRTCRICSKDDCVTVGTSTDQYDEYNEAITLDSPSCKAAAIELKYLKHLYDPGEMTTPSVTRKTSEDVDYNSTIQSQTTESNDYIYDFPNNITYCVDCTGSNFSSFHCDFSYYDDEFYKFPVIYLLSDNENLKEIEIQTGEVAMLDISNTGLNSLPTDFLANKVVFGNVKMSNLKLTDGISSTSFVDSTIYGSLNMANSTIGLMEKGAFQRMKVFQNITFANTHFLNGIGENAFTKVTVQDGDFSFENAVIHEPGIERLGFGLTEVHDGGLIFTNAKFVGNSSFEEQSFAFSAADHYNFDGIRLDEGVSINEKAFFGFLAYHGFSMQNVVFRGGIGIGESAFASGIVEEGIADFTNIKFYGGSGIGQLAFSDFHGDSVSFKNAIFEGGTGLGYMSFAVASITGDVSIQNASYSHGAGIEERAFIAATTGTINCSHSRFTGSNIGVEAFFAVNVEGSIDFTNSTLQNASILSTAFMSAKTSESFLFDNLVIENGGIGENAFMNAEALENFEMDNLYIENSTCIGEEAFNGISVTQQFHMSNARLTATGGVAIDQHAFELATVGEGFTFENGYIKGNLSFGTFLNMRIGMNMSFKGTTFDGHVAEGVHAQSFINQTLSFENCFFLGSIGTAFTKMTVDSIVFDGSYFGAATALPASSFALTRSKTTSFRNCNCTQYCFEPEAFSDLKTHEVFFDGSVFAGNNIPIGVLDNIILCEPSRVSFKQCSLQSLHLPAQNQTYGHPFSQLQYAWENSDETADNYLSDIYPIIDLSYNKLTTITANDLNNAQGSINLDHNEIVIFEYNWENGSFTPNISTASNPSVCYVDEQGDWQCDCATSGLLEHNMGFVRMRRVLTLS